MKLLIKFLVSLVGALFSLSVFAGAIIGATEPTQIMNNLQLLASYLEQAQQTATQFQQYQTMLKNLQQMTPSTLLDQQSQKLFTDQNMMQAFKNLQTVVTGGQQSAYTLSNMDQKFKQSNPGYGNGGNFSNSYRDWSANTLGSVKNALALITTHSDNFASEQGMVSELSVKSQTAAGQLQAVQAGNQISVAMVGQMQQLRQLQMAQARAQADYITSEQGEKDARHDGYDKVFGSMDRSRVR